MCKTVNPYTSRAERVACASDTKKNIRSSLMISKNRLIGILGRVQSWKNISKVKNNSSEWWSKSWSSEIGRINQEDTGGIPEVTFHSISAERKNTSIWGISKKVKYSGTNVPAATSPEITNMRGTKTILHSWLGWYRSQSEFGKSGVPPVSFQVTT